MPAVEKAGIALMTAGIVLGLLWVCNVAVMAYGEQRLGDGLGAALWLVMGIAGAAVALILGLIAAVLYWRSGRQG